MSHTLVLLPGLGGTEAVFDLLRPLLKDVVTPTWIPHRRDDTLQSYARRWAEQLRPLKPAYIGGHSFGGMLSLEMAPLLGVRAVFQISSCTAGSHVSAAGKLAERFFRHWPEPLLAAPTMLAGAMIRVFGPMLPDYRRRAVQMFASHCPVFMRWGGGAIMNWPGIDPASLPMPVYRIHGMLDPLIPRQVVQADEWIADGDHLLPLSHPAQVAAFIDRRQALWQAAA